MKIKQLLGMMALDANANEVGKIDDAEFDPKEGKINAITIVLKKNFISSNKIEIDFEDVKSIGDYVLLDKEINKEAAIEEASLKTLLKPIGDSMSICDIRGETIDIGSFIRYTGTGTISKVVDLKEEDNEQWVKLDEPALWYAADSLEVVNEKDIVDSDNLDKDTLEQVKDIKEGYEELNANLNDIQGCEGGG